MRNLKEEVPQKKYFEKTVSAAVQRKKMESPKARDLGPLYPFIISGGKVTELIYFREIENFTQYKFNIEPRYFGDESNYVDKFQKHIDEILKGSPEAKIYCVFDWDTIYGKINGQRKHRSFVLENAPLIKNKTLFICRSMPCIEYWFLLHFTNEMKLFPTCGKITKALSSYMQSYFTYKQPQSEAARLKMEQAPTKSTINFKNILKDKNYLDDGIWVKKLCEDGKLENAIKNAEENITQLRKIHSLEVDHSFSFVYLPFKNYNDDIKQK